MKNEGFIFSKILFSEKENTRRSSLPEVKIADKNPKSIRLVNFKIDTINKRDHSAPLKYSSFNYNKLQTIFTSNKQKKHEEHKEGSYENLKSSAFYVKTAMKSPRIGRVTLN
jgi:hypothetical protein